MTPSEQYYVHLLEKKNASSLANNLCPDHRDKQVGKSCLACEIEQLGKQLEAATKCIINLKDENARLSSVNDSYLDEIGDVL